MDAFKQLRQLLDNVERMLPDERRSGLSTLQRGDIVQIKPGRDPKHPCDNFGGCLFRVTRCDRVGLIHGVHLVDHRGGALEGTLGYRLEDLLYIGSTPDNEARAAVEIANKQTFQDFAERANEIAELQRLMSSIEAEDKRSRQTKRQRR